MTLTNCRNAPLALAVVLLGACASPPPPPADTAAAGKAAPDLACTLPTNCVSSLGGGDMPPLRFTGSAGAAVDMLQATLKTFPEAKVVRSDALALEVIFTTPVGFRDQVDFSIDAQAQRIDFRSVSLFGLFDWGKNRSRMKDFSTRFEQQGKP